MLCLGTGLASAQVAGASQKRPYTIGVDADFSGPFAYYGTVNKEAWNAVFTAVNKKGGIDGHKVKLIYLDNSSTPTTVVSDAKQLVGDHVLLVRSDPTSDACANIYNVTKKAHIPLSCEAIGLTTVTPPRPGLYTSQLPEPLFMTGVYKDIVKRTNSHPKIAMMIVTVVGEKDWANKLTTLAAKKGGSIVTTQAIPVTSLTNITSQTAGVLASNPDVVLTEVPPTTTSSFVKALRQGGFKGPVYSITSNFSSYITTKDPGLLETWGSKPVTSASQGSGAAQYIKNLDAVGVTGATKQNGATLGITYLTAETIVKALQKCGNSCTAKSLTADLQKVSVTLPGLTLAGGYGYTKRSHQPLRKGFALFGYTASKGKVVQKAIYPIG